MKTFASIQSQIAKLQKEADAMRQKEVAGVVARIKQEMLAYGLSPKDLGMPAGAGKAAGKKGAAKAVYQDPTTGRTWSGHGRTPGWIANAPDRSAFLVSSTAATRTSGASKAGPKRGGVAKYQDPASGKTWTGMGKPPAWIVGAKDRDAFLIDKPAASAAPAPSAAEDAAPASTASAKAAGKKSAGKKTAVTRRAPAKKVLPAKKTGPKKGNSIKEAMSARAKKAAPSPAAQEEAAA